MRILKNKDVKKEIQESRHDGPALSQHFLSPLPFSSNPLFPTYNS